MKLVAIAAAYRSATALHCPFTGVVFGTIDRDRINPDGLPHLKHFIDF